MFRKRTEDIEAQTRAMQPAAAKSEGAVVKKFVTDMELFRMGGADYTVVKTNGN